ncbi:MAG: glycosyl transferase [Micavibrio sp.]|nr:glycosyl transferase [Micavibrio sp.]
MKVIIITDAWHPQVNGVVRTYEFLSRQLRDFGHDVKVVGPHDFKRRLPMPGYPEIELAVFPYRALKQIIDSFAPDCIHISAEGPLGWAARKYCLKHNKKFSTSFHTQFPDYVAKRVATVMPSLYNFAHKMGVKYVRRFHGPSSTMMVATNSLEERLRGWGFTNKMQRVTRGANLDQFFAGEKTLFKDLKRPVALYVGRVAIEKNLDDFLSMDWDGTKVIVGDGPSKTYLEEKYPKAIFTGTKQGKDLADHYRSADLFVFPSKTDTFGMVLVEAMACGLPISGYDVTGPKDIVTEPYLGALTTDNLAIASKQALSCGTSEQRARYARDHFTWEIAGRQYESGLVQNPKPADTE